ncbi:2,3-dihydro-2,3-dihydroxybenzoate dehydrogenase [Staphylococcus pseudintermedius]|uniref:2,3-dihydro-2,3-dihydroxybenzoate dehydrogenase n=1 Tax=Staphylococcus pseudintermedius TaxID=283734 RepID=UPI0019F28E41|nr:2,3-dihydro-2,3-dihydroxybenzoate dehydrogenase [Staphylococcus pseudintermedius]EGQ3211354.1 2,3-dihydro-2,3-dihydroxybenzoate dehydrogenase [Staphylococcus pseudintermedius]EGQ3464657.1 2,3-dihydro-2,3-dihydroxybenzoate dehydrogenase [Staphylococcus pseudintermedius]EGQ3505596.1 2,3-dihydro-2,3-dihydroxybenzoate dehydrogenase [Staphylococcus pseudintermedius]EGQ3528035.1 2,3-dihydro-2,3-dihydroxybenzoate dehydrogenase [Staphylococcus pseudintermedius]EGQ3532568.1 2,3-dihydro-2,3-dihydroxy
MNFKNKKVFITGCANGIGEEICKSFLELGANVYGIDIEKINLKHNNLKKINLDITRYDECEKMIEELDEENIQIDILVNSAGILREGSLPQMPMKEVREVFEVNFFGTLNITQLIVNKMIRNKKGNIITISSNSSNTPRLNIGAYGSSKAALNSYMKNLGLEVSKYGIRCNLVSPGSTLTRMQQSMWKNDDAEKKVIYGNLEKFQIGIPLQKLATRKDIANSVLFLASDLSSHITLNELRVDGGATLGNL